MNDELEVVSRVIVRAMELVIKEMEAEYHKGNKEVLIDVLATCFQFQIKVPAWVQKPIVRAVKIERPRSWDNLFGRPVPKGKGTRAFNQREQKSMAVVAAVRLMQAQGEPVDEYLFERVGKKLGISGPTAKNYYYYKNNQMTFDEAIKAIRRIKERLPLFIGANRAALLRNSKIHRNTVQKGFAISTQSTQ